MGGAGRHEPYREYIGCIRIDDNVFVGANTIILANCHIGSNCIIGAGTLVNKSLESGFVYAGVPAKKICTFENFIEKRKQQVRYPKYFQRKGDSVSHEFANWMWKDFLL